MSTGACSTTGSGSGAETTGDNGARRGSG
jgi:hypothetical protein